MLFFLTIAKAATKLPDGIQVIVSMENTQLNHLQKILINTTFINTTEADIKLLKWHLPTAEILLEDLFDIKNSRQETIKYRGKIYKRLAPQKNDFFILKAREKVTIKTDLSLSYALTKSGFYTINYRLKNTPDSSLHFTLLEDRPAKEILEGIQKITVKSCSSNQQSKLENIVSEAAVITNVASVLLQSIKEENRPYADRYTQWFGNYDYDRYATVQANFQKIQDTLDNKEISFDCDCNDNAIAYVFPEVAYNIHLCSSFWNLDLNGTDSQAGTMVHEISHFKITAHTDDHGYGKVAAKNYSDNEPSKAIDNADNYEYFAENSDPYFSMYRTGTADLNEPDNSKEAAKLILPNASQVHTIHTKNDKDWFKFELFFPSYINLFISGPENGDTEITLFDTNGKKIASNDDKNSTKNESYSEISKDSLPTGTYYVKVNGYKNNTIVQEYQLTLTVRPEGSNKNQGSKKKSKGSIQLPLLLILLLIYLFRKKHNTFRQLSR